MPSISSDRQEKLKKLMMRGAFGAPGFSPANIAGLLVWLDAADTGTVIESGDDVSRWDDKSSNSIDFLQGTGGNQPLYTANSINGLHTVDFSLAETSFIDAVAGINTGVSGDFTLYYLMRHAAITSITGTEVVFGSHTVADFPSMQSVLGPAAGAIASEVITYTMVDAGGTATHRQYTQTNIAAGVQLHTIGYRASDDTVRFQINGVDLTTLEVSGGFAAAFSLFGIKRFGSNPDTLTPFHLEGDMGEIIAYDSYLTDAQHAQSLKYLQDKWIAP